MVTSLYSKEVYARDSCSYWVEKILARANTFTLSTKYPPREGEPSRKLSISSIHEHLLPFRIVYVFGILDKTSMDNLLSFFGILPRL